MYLDQYSYHFYNKNTDKLITDEHIKQTSDDHAVRK